MARFLQSRYTIIVPLTKGRALAYNSLSGGLALWEAEERAVYDEVIETTALDEEDPTLRALAQGGYIVPANVDELAIIQQQYMAHRFDASTMILTIAPTLACNFGCGYCFQGQEKSRQTMSQQVQDAVVRLVQRVTPKIRYLHVAWYGGEPLLRMNILESLSECFIALCDQNGIRYDAVIVTNGYMLSAKIVESLHLRRVKQVQVTLDGTPDHHDSRRVLLSGEGTFEKIIGNIKEWIDKVPLIISIRVNVDARNRDDIHDLIDYMAKIGLAQKRNLRMYFAPIEATTEGCHYIASMTMAKQEYSQLETELYRHGFEVGITTLPYPPRFRGSCAAVRPKGFVIVPNGDIHKCWNTVSWPERRVGTILDVDALNHDERVLNWLRWTPFENSACRNCRILPVCAGACAYKFVHSGDTRGEAAVIPCPSWKYSINERLILRAEKMNFITKDDYEPDMIRTGPARLCPVGYSEGTGALPENKQSTLAQIEPGGCNRDESHLFNISDIGGEEVMSR